MIVWTSDQQDGFGNGVFSRLLDSGGSAQSKEFQINPYTVGEQSSPSVATNEDGHFVVVWRSNASPPGVLVRLFERTGAPAGPAQIVSFLQQSTQQEPDVVWTGDGFVVVWQGLNQDGSHVRIFGQRFDDDGNALGQEFMVNSSTAGNETLPAVDASTDGSFVAVWTDSSSDGSSFGIFGQRFDRDGVKQAGEFQVNSYTPGSQVLARIAVQPAVGGFVVVWQDAQQDGSSFGVFGRRFDEGGAPLASEFQVNVRTLDGQLSPDVAAAQDRGFLGAWATMNQNAEAGPTTARWFGIGGEPLGDEFEIDSYPQSQNGGPAIAVNPSGSVVATWPTRLNSGPSDYDVFARFLPAASSPEIPTLSELGSVALVLLVAGIGVTILRRALR